jgi:predicted metal-binding protein
MQMLSDEKVKEFDFLKNTALKIGAADTKIINTDNIYVENRVTLKCQIGCVNYGKKLTCPPNVPTADEFRKILSEYQYALLVKFKSPAKADDNLTGSIYRSWLDSNAPKDLKEKADIFWSDYADYNKEIHNIMLELEKAAFNMGYTFALAFVNGPCRLCSVCNTKGEACIYPSMARISEHAVGVNMKKTAKEAGMEIKFPISGHPEPMTILLIE